MRVSCSSRAMGSPGGGAKRWRSSNSRASSSGDIRRKGKTQRRGSCSGYNRKGLTEAREKTRVKGESRIRVCAYTSIASLRSFPPRTPRCARPARGAAALPGPPLTASACMASRSEAPWRALRSGWGRCPPLGWRQVHRGQREALGRFQERCWHRCTYKPRWAARLGCPLPGRQGWTARLGATGKSETSCKQVETRPGSKGARLSVSGSFNCGQKVSFRSRQGESGHGNKLGAESGADFEAEFEAESASELRRKLRQSLPQKLRQF